MSSFVKGNPLDCPRVRRLEIATLGGARVLGRRECGGRVALLLAGPCRVRDLIVEGPQVVRDGQMVTLDLPLVVVRQNRLARALMGW